MLTALAVSQLQPKPKPYKVYDKDGLLLLVPPTGSPRWRFKYRFEGKEMGLPLGTVADVSLSQARAAVIDARKLLNSGIDPATKRRIEKHEARTEQREQERAVIASGDTFEVIAREWYEKQKNEWTERHASYVLRRLEAYVFPVLGSTPIASIQAPDVLDCLRKIEDKDGDGPLEMARRCRQYISSVFAYAIATDRAKIDPAASLAKAMKRAPREKHVPAIEPKELPALLQAIASYEGQLTQLALQLLLLSAVRTGELIAARWDEIDTKGALWTVPAERTKMRRDHLVPLSTQALAIIAKIRKLTGKGVLLFPSATGPEQPMSNNTMLFALYKLGYKGRMTAHGARSVFSTAANESQQFSHDVIERQLAHVPLNETRAAYNRSMYLNERKRLMQWWGNVIEAKAAEKAPTKKRKGIASLR